MRLARLKKVLNGIEDNGYEVQTEEVPGRGEDNTDFEHHLLVFDKVTKRVIIKMNLNRNQVYYSNGRGIKE